MRRQAWTFSLSVACRNNTILNTLLPNNSMEPTPASPGFGFGAILALGWPGGSSRGR
jgi:hypothetical protein